MSCQKGLPILIRLRKRAHGALVAASRTKNKVVGDGSGEEDDLSHLVGSAKLRRVQAPLRGPSASSSNGTGAAVGIGMAGGADGTPSPNSGGSIATASTLVDNGLYDAGVPAFAGDQATPLVASSYPAGSYPLMTSSSWGSEDPLNGYIPNYLISCSGAGPGAGTNRNTWPNISNSSPSTNVPVSPEYDGQVGVDMDMSMALGINMSMGMGGGWVCLASIPKVTKAEVRRGTRMGWRDGMQRWGVRMEICLGLILRFSLIRWAGQLRLLMFLYSAIGVLA